MATSETQENSITVAEQAKQPSQAQSLPALTGLRFVAAFMVVISHLSGKFGLPAVELYIGAMAVSFFFVLSGFILTHVYRERLKLSNVGGFYLRRWARIWPLHLVCFLIALFGLSLPFNWPMGLTNLGLLHSWVPDSSWVFSFNVVSWSISTEMFFYVMFPLLMLGGQKQFWVKFLCLLTAAVAVVYYLRSMTIADPAVVEKFDLYRVVHVNPFLRLPEFMVGMALGFLYHNRAPNRKPKPLYLDTVFEVFVLSGIWLYFVQYEVIFSYLFRSDWAGPLVAQWFNYVGTTLVFAPTIYVFARSHGLFNRLMGSRLFVFLGEISFALYMIHWVVLRFYESRDWSLSEASPWLMGGLIVSISLAASALLYQFVEVPSRKGIVDCFSNGFKSMVQVYKTEIGKFLKAPVFWLAIATLVGSIWAFEKAYVPIELSDSARQVVYSTHYTIRDVQFGPNLRLMGFNAEAAKDGIVIKLVWQKTGPVPRFRFAHIVGADGKIVAQMPPDREFFKNAAEGQPFEEAFTIPDSMLEKANSIGIGFFSNEIDPKTSKAYDTVEIDKGPRSMNNKRLDIVSPELLKALKP